MLQNSNNVMLVDYHTFVKYVIKCLDYLIHFKIILVGLVALLYLNARASISII